MISELIGTIFMINPGTGGRGKSAPYSTVHYRIPSPIKPTVERLANAYRALLTGERNWTECERLLKRVNAAVGDSSSNGKVSQFDQELVELKSQLAIAQEQVNQLKAEREQTLSILVPAMKNVKANAAGKLIKAVREAFPNLPKE